MNTWRLMSSLCSTKNIGPTVGFGVLCLPLWLALIPNLEEGRQEARTSWAFAQVRGYQEEVVSGQRPVGLENHTVNDMPAADGFAVTELPERDPWGQPFRLVTKHGVAPIECYVFSSGPDEVSASIGRDPDDVASDMKVHPNQPFSDKRRRQWLVAFGVSGAVWMLLMGLIASNRRQGEAESTHSAPVS